MNVSDSEALRESLFRTLTYDVMEAISRLESDGTQSNRRNLVRTMFAAIEGYVWEYRRYVRSLAQDIDTISPLMELALSEITYSVGENGNIEQHVRYISLTAMIRLVTKLAQKISPKLKADFGSGGWLQLKKAIAVRNRVTHPKSMADLHISSDEIEFSKQGYFWILELIVTVMEATLRSAQVYNLDLRALVEQLASGDPQALEDYRATHKNMLD